MADYESEGQFSRLVYLLTKFGVTIPVKLKKYLPHYDWLGSLHHGIYVAANKAGVPPDNISSMYYDGENQGVGSRYEALFLLAQYADRKLADEDIPLAEKTEMYAFLDAMMKGGDMLIEAGEINLGELQEIQEIPKFRTGFSPVDRITGGIYQGIFGFMAVTGTGKTSLLCTLSEEMVRNNACGSILWVQTEIPKLLMLGRMAPVFRRGLFRPQDVMLVGSYNAAMITAWVREHPDPDRVVIYDSPDVMAGSGSKENDLRFQYKAEFEGLVQLKQHVKAIFIGTQPHRAAVNGRLDIDSVGESWDKAKLSDCMIVWRVVREEGKYHRLVMRTVKNRFWLNKQKETFDYNYNDLTWKGVLPGAEDGEDDEDW